MFLFVKDGLVTVSTVQTLKIDYSFLFDKWICLTTTFELCLRTAEFIMISVIMQLLLLLHMIKYGNNFKPSAIGVVHSVHWKQTDYTNLQ